MKYLTLYAKQIFIPKDKEISKKQYVNAYVNTHTHTFTKLDKNETGIHNPLNADEIGSHITYLHKLHTKQFIQEKEEEENPHYCSYICRKIMLFMKF